MSLGQASDSTAERDERASTATPTPPSVPDWSALPGDLLCPLCEYNLRGLVDPRCPECGYRFEWGDLTDPTRKKHPYLFEHHPERNVWSFTRTALGLLLPRRFWRTMRPEQPSNVRRLVVYWLISWLVGCGGMCVGTFILEARHLAAIVEYNRPTRPALLARNPEWREVVIREYGSIETYLDAELPWPLSAGFFRKSAEFTWEQLRHHDAVVVTLALMLAWPWLTFAGLASFRLSMRPARIRSAHVLRCVLYSYDVGIWSAVVIVGVAVLTPWRAWMLRWGGDIDRFLTSYSLTFLKVAAAVTLYRLVVAHRAYLRFDHAVAMVTAAHVVIVLSAAAVAFYTPGLWEWLCNYFVLLL